MCNRALLMSMLLVHNGINLQVTCLKTRDSSLAYVWSTVVQRPLPSPLVSQQIANIQLLRRLASSCLHALILRWQFLHGWLDNSRSWLTTMFRLSICQSLPTNLLPLALAQRLARLPSHSIGPQVTPKRHSPLNGMRWISLQSKPMSSKLNSPSPTTPTPSLGWDHSCHQIAHSMWHCHWCSLSLQV